MPEKILFVDDDANILSSLQRQLRKVFEVDVAQGPEEGLEAITGYGPHAVVVSDLRMPGMDGIEFLGKVKKASPDSTRIVLTGNADLENAMTAVNEGNIYRFLTKPVDGEVLEKVLNNAIEQYRLVTSEKMMLRSTLSGAIKVLTEIMSLVSPVAFGRASRMRRYVWHMAKELGVQDSWHIELAAMLSQIGCVVMPEDILDKIYAGEKLSPEQMVTFSKHKMLGGELMANIPRMELVAELITRQDEFTGPQHTTLPPAEREPALLGSQMLRVALCFDEHRLRGISHQRAIALISIPEAGCDPVLVKTLETFDDGANDGEVPLGLSDLKLGMIFANEVRTIHGVLTVTRGQEVTAPVLERLKQMLHAGLVEEPFRVLDRAA